MPRIYFLSGWIVWIIFIAFAVCLWVIFASHATLLGFLLNLMVSYIALTFPFSYREGKVVFILKRNT